MRLIFLAVCILFFFQGFGQDNSQWRGPNRDGIYSETGLFKVWPEKGLDLIWQYDSLGLGFTSVTIYNETLYTTGIIDSTGYIFALSPEGSLKWKKPYGKEWQINYIGSRSTPVIVEDYGYILSGLGVIYCFDVNTGDFIWTIDLFKKYKGKQIRFGITENLLIYDDKLICTPGDSLNNVLALNRRTGDLIWKSQGVHEASAYGTPRLITHNKKDYLIVNSAKSIMALDPENGKFYWSFDMGYPHGIHGNVPVYKDGYLFAMNGWGFGSLMLKISDSGESVKQVWRSKYHDLEHGDVILMHDNIYGSDYTSKLFLCTDWKTGIAKDSIKDLAPSSVIAAEGLIYCYTYKGELALIKPKPEGFDIISRFQTPYGKKKDHLAFPVIHKGRLYVRYANHLSVYSIKNE
jgi:outer membrane protein assembly factor BamB